MKLAAGEEEGEGDAAAVLQLPSRQTAAMARAQRAGRTLVTEVPAQPAPVDDPQMSSAEKGAEDVSSNGGHRRAKRERGASAAKRQVLP